MDALLCGACGLVLHQTNNTTAQRSQSLKGTKQQMSAGWTDPAPGLLYTCLVQVLVGLAVQRHQQMT